MADNVGYEVRRAALLLLGYVTYEDYLQSDLWREIREKVFLRDKHKCRLCDKPAACVHHIDYSLPTIKGEQLHLMYSMCHGCHHRVEFTVKDVKMKFSHVVAKTLRLLKSKGKKSNRHKSKPWIGMYYKARQIRRRGYR